MTGRGRLDAGGFGDLARTDAAGAHSDVFRLAVHQRAHTLDVGQPTPLGHVVGVRDIASTHRAFAADFTSLRHRRIPPRGPHLGVELFNTCDSIMQVRASLSVPYFCLRSRRSGDSDVK